MAPLGVSTKSDLRIVNEAASEPALLIVNAPRRVSPGLADRWVLGGLISMAKRLCPKAKGTRASRIAKLANKRGFRAREGVRMVPSL